jgi:heterotetrameric sarcosine oxidase gamma subunit
MTAISPLQSIHQKGLFGDHHKKNKIDIVSISEEKDYNIIQIVKHKSSTINLSNIFIDGLEIPLENFKVSSNQNTRILWNAPNTWLVFSKKEDINNTIQKKCDDKNFAITNISHSRAIIQIKGIKAKEILKKGCPLNFDKFRINNSTSSIFHGVTFVIDCISDDPETFNLIALRSFGESLYHHITDSALEFGYIGT